MGHSTNTVRSTRPVVSNISYFHPENIPFDFFKRVETTNSYLCNHFHTFGQIVATSRSDRGNAAEVSGNHRRTLTEIQVSVLIPIVSMYGIFTYIYHRNPPNVSKYAIH